MHLIAQASAADIAAQTSTSEKREKLADTVTQMLHQLGLEDASSADLAKRMEKVDIASGNLESIVSTVGAYMKEGLGVAAEQVEQVLEQGKVALGHALPSLGIVSEHAANGDASQINGDATVNGESRSKTLVIENVKDFKASMPLSAGPRAVKDLSEFEELGAKL